MLYKCERFYKKNTLTPAIEIVTIISIGGMAQRVAYFSERCTVGPESRMHISKIGNPGREMQSNRKGYA